MKLALVLAALPLLASASPISSNPATDAIQNLEKRDKYCTLGANVDYDVHCRKDAGSGYDHVRWIHPSDPGLPGDKLSVSCKAYGEVINGNRVWDKIPGWGCWVSAHHTNSGCETGVSWC